MGLGFKVFRLGILGKGFKVIKGLRVSDLYKLGFRVSKVLELLWFN